MRPFRQVWPRIHPEAWIAPGAIVVGDVQIGASSSVWYASVLRGDTNWIRVGERSNVQDQCVVHVTAERHPCSIGDEVTIGHRAVVHGCTVRDGAQISIGAVVLDGAEIGEGALVGAGALVVPGMVVPDAAVVLGVPGRIGRSLEEAERAEQRARALEYVRTAHAHAAADGSP